MKTSGYQEKTLVCEFKAFLNVLSAATIVLIYFSPILNFVLRISLSLSRSVNLAEVGGGKHILDGALLTKGNLTDCFNLE